MRKTTLSLLGLALSFGVFAQYQNTTPEITKLRMPFQNLVFVSHVFPADHFKAEKDILAEGVKRLSPQEDYPNIKGVPEAFRTKGSFLILSSNEEVILAFGDYPIRNSMGQDIFIFCENNPLNLIAYISHDGIRWHALGKVNPERPAINLKKEHLKGRHYKYLKLKNGSREGDVKVDAVALALLEKNDKRYFQIPEDTLLIRGENPIVRIKDYRITDGDRVALMLNNKVIRQVKLNKAFTEVELDLEPGLHKIAIRALNRGFLYPNTFSFEIMDEEIIYYEQLRLNTGRQATLMLEKSAK